MKSKVNFGEQKDFFRKSLLMTAFYSFPYL